MKAMFLGFLAAAIIAVAASFSLGAMGFSSAEASAGENVRLD